MMYSEVVNILNTNPPSSTTSPQTTCIRIVVNYETHNPLHIVVPTFQKGRSLSEMSQLSFTKTVLKEGSFLQNCFIFLLEGRMGPLCLRDTPQTSWCILFTPTQCFHPLFKPVYYLFQFMQMLECMKPTKLLKEFLRKKNYAASASTCIT